MVKRFIVLLVSARIPQLSRIPWSSQGETILSMLGLESFPSCQEHKTSQNHALKKAMGQDAQSHSSLPNPRIPWVTMTFGPAMLTSRSHAVYHLLYIDHPSHSMFLLGANPDAFAERRWSADLPVHLPWNTQLPHASFQSSWATSFSMTDSVPVTPNPMLPALAGLPRPMLYLWDFLVHPRVSYVCCSLNCVTVTLTFEGLLQTTQLCHMYLSLESKPHRQSWSFGAFLTSRNCSPTKPKEVR